MRNHGRGIDQVRQMKILNLYAGIGGNRKLWGDNHQVTAVEYDEDIARVYADHFPNDKVIIADAHEYLLNHFNEFDFIWTSPPCQSHSSFRQNIGVRFRGVKPIYADMKLWQEIVFLQYNFKGQWVVENVKPYYTPFIPPTADLQRHYFWANFDIAQTDIPKDNLRAAQIPQLQELHGYNLDGYKLPNKRQVLRNCVLPALGKHVFDQVQS
jgi:DNA (cytosine-5)-methyltransferase 1